ncbi:hypothetical protein K438DRAFT_1970938 [Mycena galopus ATCC 62051]|nr:hypothetical protein K438DRAFT_1970938 [Mycena galopus ATCC 62051]
MNRALSPHNGKDTEEPQLEAKETSSGLTSPKPTALRSAKDFDRVDEVLGMKSSDFHTTEQTTLDTVDALIEAEER